MTKSLYIHIPFCQEICSYCDFAKVFSKGQDIDNYLDFLLKELSIYEKTVGFHAIETVYFGGGTPSVLTAVQFERVFSYLESVIDFTRLKEVSIEGNPESLNDEFKLSTLKRLGVTRISVGVQTFNENHLLFLERNHSRGLAIDIIKKLALYDFQINVDLIYAIPHQTLTDWKEDLKIICSLPVTHISAYSLILEENTKLYINHKKRQINFVDNELEALMFEEVINTLTRVGYHHYEISNFTNKEPSYHNETYWKNEAYIAVGLGSHGLIPSNEKMKPWIKPDIISREIIQNSKGNIRYANTRSINSYKEMLRHDYLPILDSRRLSVEEHVEEAMFLGLRRLEGVNVNQIGKTYGFDVLGAYEKKIEDLTRQGLLTFEAPILRLTKKGLMLANFVFEAFLL